MSAPRPQQYRPPGPPPPQQARQPSPQQQAPQQQTYQRPPEPPAPQPPAPQPPAQRTTQPRGDGTAMTVLRVVTYVLTSLASIVFLVMAIYAYIAFANLQEAISTNPLFGGGGGLPSGLDVPTSVAPQICATLPDAPGCELY